MHLLLLVVAMLFVASTPYMAKTEGRDVEWTESSTQEPTPSDDESKDDVIPLRDAEAPDDRADA